MVNAKEIRKELKNELGYNAKEVSVSIKNGSIHFTIRATNVDYNKLKTFSHKFESYLRDEATGCILKGGNTFAFVKFSDKTRADLIARNISEVEKAIEKIDNNYLAEIKETNFLIGKDQSGCGFTIWKKNKDRAAFVLQCYNPEEAAMAIATN